MPRLRRNPLTGDWVVIAPERSRRPSDYRPMQPPVARTHEACSFCSNGQAAREALEPYTRSTTFVIPNKFPAFTEQWPVPTVPQTEDVGFYHQRPAVGQHHVVVVRDAALALPDFPVDVWQDLLESFRTLIDHYSQLGSVVHALPMYNHGPAAGASIDHPHAQVVGSPIMPPHIGRELEASAEYAATYRECLLCALLEYERGQRLRVVAESADYVAITCYAARFPFELWVVPREHRDRYEQLSGAQLAALASFLPRVFHAYRRALHDPALNFFIHTLPLSLDRVDWYHWHLEVTPRLSPYGGYELGSGTIIDIVSPEQAAAYLRDPNHT